MSALQDVYRQNRTELSKYRQLLRMVPKVVAIYAADSALAGVMVPNAKNYTKNEKPAGKLMVHDSSNAAWNWRIGISGKEEAPIYAGPAHIDHPVVGDHFEHRASNSASWYTIKERRILDINTKLYNSLFSKPLSNPKNFSIYNSIKKLGFGEKYAERANIEAATSQLSSYAKSGEAMGLAVLDSYARASNGAPNPQGLLAHLKNASSSNFITWI